MRDIKELHPNLQGKIKELEKKCADKGIKIGIGECVRTVAEQDALYAKGRTIAGSVVTNAKGSSYSSMHQWGVAFDFYLIMDVDGDGKTSDDAFNDATGLFNEVVKIGKSIGLEWGGDWKTIKDKPHFQLPDWGSTAALLKKKYGTPKRFMESWCGGTEVAHSSATTKKVIAKNDVEPAKSKDKKYIKPWTTKVNLNLRNGAGADKPIVTTIPKGTTVMCYGYYTKRGDSVWLSVQYGKYQGYVLKTYLR